MKILICGVSTGGDVTTHFMVSALKLQTELARTPGTTAAFEITDSVEAAIGLFDKNPDFERLVIVDTDSSVDNAFIVQNDHDFIFATVPIPAFDWDRVSRVIAKTSEPLHTVGNTYNVDPNACDPVPGGRFLRMRGNFPECMPVFSISRAVIDTIVQVHGDSVRSDDGQLVIFAPGIIDGVRLTSSQRMCVLYGAPVYADIRHATVTSSAIPFGPCDMQARLKSGKIR